MIPEPASTPPVRSLLEKLGDLVSEFQELAPAADAAESIERIAALETVNRAASGALAAEEVAFAAGQRAEQIAAGVKARDLGRGIAEQIAFARGISPTSGARHLAYAQSLMARLPQTYAELRAGRISETQARVAVTRSSHLSDTDVGVVDAAIAPRMSGWNVGATEKAVDHAAYAIDPRGSVDRKAAAEKDRRVWVRPAPDSMAIVSALLPMAQGVAVFANLQAAAQSLRGTGAAEGRGLGQVMADLLVTRCTGQARADAVPMEIRVTMPVDSLLGTSDLPAWVDDYGPLPAPLVRELCDGGSHPDDGENDHRGATPAENEDPRLWIRRLFVEPVDGSTVAVDPRRRLFPKSLARHITIRDRTCRQPYCSSPIREVDHVVPYRQGGPTTLENGQGLCLRGNKLKDLPAGRRGGARMVRRRSSRRPVAATSANRKPLQVFRRSRVGSECRGRIMRDHDLHLEPLNVLQEEGRVLRPAGMRIAVREQLGPTVRAGVSAKGVEFVHRGARQRQVIQTGPQAIVPARLHCR